MDLLHDLTVIILSLVDNVSVDSEVFVVTSSFVNLKITWISLLEVLIWVKMCTCIESGEFAKCLLLCREQFFGHSTNSSLPSVIFETLGKNSVCKCFIIALGKQVVAVPWPHERVFAKCHFFSTRQTSLLPRVLLRLDNVCEAPAKG